MAQVFTLHAFSPFSLTTGSNIHLHKHAQQAVWYAESCFRKILIAISRAELKHQQWMQYYLVKELVSANHTHDQGMLTPMLSKYFCYWLARHRQSANLSNSPSSSDQLLIVFTVLRPTCYLCHLIKTSWPHWTMG